MQKTICVYCSSSDAVSQEYFTVANELGEAIAKNKFKLIYGGANVGLMGAVAHATHLNNGGVIGVIPKIFDDRNLTFTKAEEVILTTDLRERKAILEERSDAFIALPGGFGTLDEVLEIITAKQLNFHSHPVIFINTNNYFGKLLEQFDFMFSEQFAKPDYKQLYYVADTVENAMQYITEYQATSYKTKWFDGKLHGE